jgi:alanine dehydrogenase
MPAACARTASIALERAVLPFLFYFLRNESNPELRSGIQVRGGNITHEKLARDTGRGYSPA